VQLSIAIRRASASPISFLAILSEAIP
jgi:hypothetical protein